MVAQKGKDLLLKIDGDGEGNYVTVAGLRSKRIAFNSETVDVTCSGSAGRWRELLAGSGVQRASVSGAGIFKDQASAALDLMRIIGAGLRGAGADVTDDDVGRMQVENGAAGFAAIAAELLTVTFGAPAPEGAAPQNP